MIADVRERLLTVPFAPFVVRTSDGREYPVPTRDHAHISPRVNRVVIFLDTEPAVLLGSLHINGIVEQHGNGE
jgi:hypothetical protein